MGIGSYIGIGGVSKKLKSAYVGVGGAVKKIKEIYVGVGGIPKLVWRNALTYTADLISVNGSGFQGTLNGSYTNDNNHIIGSAIVTEFNGTTTKNLYIPLPIALPAGSVLGEQPKSATLKVYNSAGSTLLATYSIADGDLIFTGKSSTQCVRATNSSGWSKTENRKLELTFDYYIHGA